jgi:hypothetical protein
MTKIEITKFGIDWTMLRHVPHVYGGFSHGHFGAYSLSAVGSAVLLQLCSAQHTAGESTMMWSRCVAADQRAPSQKSVCSSRRVTLAGTLEAALISGTIDAIAEFLLLDRADLSQE